MVNYCYLIKFILFLFCINLQANTNQVRYRYNFNYDWKLMVGDVDDAVKSNYNDNSWKEISLPYAWNQEEAFKSDIEELSTGIAWYRKHFTLPKEYKGKKIFIEFEGVRQAAEVFVNGQYIGLHENGITAFGFDISDYVQFGGKKNVIAVKTDNSWDYKEKSSETTFQWNNIRFNANYGGIPKNVVLHITGNVYQTLPLYSNLKTTGQYIYASNIDIQNKTAIITAESEVKNELAENIEINYEVLIEDLNGKILKSIDGGKYNLAPGDSRILRTSDKIYNLNFWSWGYGYLYKIHTILKQDNRVIDSVCTRTGFRKTEFYDGLVRLNNRVIMMKGYAQRTTNEWPAVGMSVPPWLSDYSNKLMIESNGNLVRWMHVTPSKQDVESCDRVGLIQAMPAGDAEKDKEGRKWDQRVEVMRDAIIYFRNNPSIFFYECGNNDISEEHMLEMKDLKHKYDPNGGRAIGSRNMLDSKHAEYGGEMLYINKSSKKPVWAMEYMRDEALRKYWDDYTPPYHKNGDGPLYRNQDASPYNQNQDSYACQVVERWFDYYRERPGTGDRVSSGGVNIVFSETNTHHRGAENYRRSGEVDALRIPKDAFYAHQVMWNGWVDPEEHDTHIIGHWNYEKGVKKSIYVVSTGEKVELFVNGMSKGFGKKEFNFLFSFENIEWNPGKIEARSYSDNNELLSYDSIVTTKKPESIKLTLINSTNELVANGADIALIEVEVIDDKGFRCPVAMNMVEFDLKGSADWVGGMAQGTDNYILSKNLPVECGVNRIMVRSTTNAGEIKLTANSAGLKSDSIVLYSKPIESKDGLSTFFPSTLLPVNLDKGPTPNTPSYQVTRKSVNIISAKAGSNQETAINSFDGSQTTRWENDGTLTNGWIEYKLEKKADVKEIALKLSGWRTRSYPIVVTADDSVIYRGITTPNLGYFYIVPEHSLVTNNIKIRLFGPTEFNDVYKLVEITGRLDKETENDMAVKDANGLNIAEVEIFENP